MPTNEEQEEWVAPPAQPEVRPWAQARYDSRYELEIKVVRKDTLKEGFTPEHGVRSRRMTEVAHHRVTDEAMPVLILKAQALIGLLEEKEN